MAYTSPDTMIDYLLSSGLSVSDLCKRSGINRRTFYYYLNRRQKGGRPLQHRTVEKLDRAYKQRLRELGQDEIIRGELGL